jgi:hypothetical protein
MDGHSKSGSKRHGTGRAYHSVLEPHFERIRQLRRQRMTWREIAERLNTDLGLQVTLHAVYRFCRRRMRRPQSWEEGGAVKRQDQSPLTDGPPLSESANLVRPSARGPASPQTPPSQVPSTQRVYLPTPKFRRPDPQTFNRDDYP